MWEIREVLEYHGQMLTDGPRTSAYADAIARTVRAGDVVLDIGTGTGILAMLAARAGARVVYAIEEDPVVELARRVVAANGLDGIIEIVHAQSHAVTLPERADVLVSEILWNAGLGEGILSSFADARARLLKPEARIIPSALEMWVAPVEAPVAHESVHRWSDDLAGFDYSPLREIAANATFTRWFDEDALLAPGAVLGAVGLTDPPAAFSGAAGFTAARDGTLHGLAGWFAADLVPGVRLSNPPPVRGSWMHAYLPVNEPVPLSAGERIDVQAEVLTADELWRWSVEAAGAVQEGSTLTDPLRGSPG